MGLHANEYFIFSKFTLDSFLLLVDTLDVPPGSFLDIQLVPSRWASSIGNPRCCQFLPHPRVLYLRSCSGHLLILPLWSVSRTDFVIPPTDESTVLARRGGNTVIPKWEKAVEGISGAAVIYTAFAMILTCFLGGITFFSFLGVVLDILFCGGFIAIAILTDGGRNSCSGVINSPIGSGEYLSCQLQRVVFIVAIIAALVVYSCQTPSIN